MVGRGGYMLWAVIGISWRYIGWPRVRVRIAPGLGFVSSELTLRAYDAASVRVTGKTGDTCQVEFTGMVMVRVRVTVTVGDRIVTRPVLY